MNRHLPILLESLHCCIGNDARGNQQLGGGNHNLANRNKHSVSSDAIPNPDIATAGRFCNRDIHIIALHPVAVEILHRTLPRHTLRLQATPLRGSQQAKSTLNFRIAATTRAGVVLEQHFHSRLQVEGQAR